MTPQEYMQLINRIEEACPVDQWKVGGTRIWPLLRVGLGFRLDSYAQGYMKDKLIYHGYNVLRDLANYAKATVQDLKNNQAPQSADAVFLTMTLERSFLFEGRWYNNFCDPLIEKLEELGMRSQILEYSGKGDYRTPRYSRSHYIQPSLNAAAVQSVISDAAPDTSSWKGFDHFLKLLQESGCGLGSNDIRGLLKRYGPVRRWADFFKSQLERVRPRIAFVVSYYGPLGMSFALACRELGIKCVDLQHGVQGEVHVAYGNWNRIPPDGYEMIPSDFWCWTETEREIIQRWASGTQTAHRAIFGGNPLVAEFKDKFSVLSIGYGKRLDQLLGNGRKHILITLQATGLNDFYEQLIRGAPDDWTWWIRAHPVFPVDANQLGQKLKGVSTARWNLKEATALPLLALLGRMDAHVTEFSSAVLEAEAFAVPSVVTHETGPSFFPTQIARGTAVAALSPDKALRALTQLVNHPLPLPAHEPPPLANVLKELLE